jgi:hypothetical protein
MHAGRRKTARKFRPHLYRQRRIDLVVDEPVHFDDAIADVFSFPLNALN